MMRRPVTTRPTPVSRPTTLTAVLTAFLLLSGAACASSSGTKPGNAQTTKHGHGGRAAPVPSGSAPEEPRAVPSDARHRPVPSDACHRTTPPPASGRHTFRGRSYLLKRPNNDGRAPAPLILDFHGLRSTAFAQALYRRMADTGAARGFIVVEPESVPRRKGWKLPGMPNGSADITYIDALLDHLESTLCVDTSREYASGMSNGAGLAAALICGLDGRLAGVAPVAGLNLARPCTGAPPTIIVAFHGTGDRIVPYRGGEPFGGDRRQIPTWMRPSDGAFALPAVTRLTARWAHAFGCGTTPERTSTGRDGEISQLIYPGCDDGVHVDLYTVKDGGHSWPGAFPPGVGTTTARLDATRIILDAFAVPSR